MSDKLRDLKHPNHLTRPELTAARSNNSEGSYPPKMHSSCSGGGSPPPKPEPPNLTNELSFFSARFQPYPMRFPPNLGRSPSDLARSQPYLLDKILARFSKMSTEIHCFELIVLNRAIR